MKVFNRKIELFRTANNTSITLVFVVEYFYGSIGGFISKNKEAYEYLPSSIENFLDAKSFCDELVEAGFEIELCKGFSMDISTLFIAKKVKEINA